MKLVGFLFSLTFLFLSCFNNPSNDNNGNPTNPILGRALRGKFVDASNRPVSGATVRLYRVDYVPSFSLSKSAAIVADTTDESGNFAIPLGDSGTFNIEGTADTLGVFVDSVKVDTGKTDVDVPQQIMKKLGMIRGISHMAGQNDTNQVRVTLYMPGTGRITMPVIGGKFAFEDVPAGKYQIIVNPTLNQYNVKIIDTTLIAGDTLDLDTVSLGLYLPDTVDIMTSTVSGVWGPNRTYNILNSILVPNNLTLTILPGTKVRFMGYYEMDVDGNLFVRGDSANTVIITSGLPNPSVASWDCIGNFCSGSSSIPDSVSISYAIIEYAGRAIHFKLDGAQTKTIQIRNSVIRYIGQIGISFAQNGNTLPVTDTIEIINSIIHDCGNGALGIYSTQIPLLLKLVNTAFLNNAKEADYYITFCGTSCGSSEIYSDDSVFVYNWFNCHYNNGIMRSHSIETVSQITADPLFYNTLKGHEDYHLQSASPCNGAGKNGTDIGIYSTYNGN